jgi:hypothetical protein
LGEPVPGLFTTPLVVLAMIALIAAEADDAGFADMYSAATPAVCGVAIDVPLIVFVAVVDEYHDDVMFTPGAKRSTQVP